jgi:hypothetical protein
MTTKLPIQHQPTVHQFTCRCDKVVTFAQASTVYPLLINRTSPGPKIIVGECPFCGQKHWRGMTRL